MTTGLRGTTIPSRRCPTPILCRRPPRSPPRPDSRDSGQIESLVGATRRYVQRAACVNGAEFGLALILVLSGSTDNDGQSRGLADAGPHGDHTRHRRILGRPNAPTASGSPFNGSHRLHGGTRGEWSPARLPPRLTPRTAQAAMRHSSLDLTMNVYTDPKLLNVAGAIEALPALPLADDLRREPLGATGTDSPAGTARRFAPGFAPTPYKSATPGSIPDRMAALDAAAKKAEDPRLCPENQGFSGLSPSRGERIRTSDFLLPKQAR